MTKDEALKLALEAFGEIEWSNDSQWQSDRAAYAMLAIKEALAQPEQEPVAMKFKIYKPTVPDPMRQGINNALLPWVYDQDRNSGFDATMWVTPVATLPPQRKPLTDEEIHKASTQAGMQEHYMGFHSGFIRFARAIEEAHGIKGLV